MLDIRQSPDAGRRWSYCFTKPSNHQTQVAVESAGDLGPSDRLIATDEVADGIQLRLDEGMGLAWLDVLNGHRVADFEHVKDAIPLCEALLDGEDGVPRTPPGGRGDGWI